MTSIDTPQAVNRHVDEQLKAMERRLGMLISIASISLALLTGFIVFVVSKGVFDADRLQTSDYIAGTVSLVAGIGLYCFLVEQAAHSREQGRHSRS
ncbi:MAG TPA: hypothetical protein VGH03_14135 [Caulobacteraceae bacterium]|jgi:uncharacterized membrane protein